MTTANAPTAPALRRWLEMLAAGTAVIVSLASLYIAWHQSRVMERQLAASVWPSLEYVNSNIAEGKSVVTMAIHNGGVGPARIRSFEVAYDGKPVRTKQELVDACCAGLAHGALLVSGSVVGRIVAANDTIVFLLLERTDANAALWDRLDAVRMQITGRLCYCSVLDDCWSVDLDAQPVPVASCDAADARPQYR